MADPKDDETTRTTMADGAVPQEILDRDAHLARLRSEQKWPSVSEHLGNLDTLSKYATDPTKLQDRALEWARDRMSARLRRLTIAGVPIGDLDRYAIALLAPPRRRLVENGVEFEAAPDTEEARELVAIKSLRERFLRGHKGFGKSTALTAVRNVLYDRANNRLTRSVLSLLGNTGVGKTCAAAHAIASIDGGRYIKAKAMFDLFTSFHRDDRAELRALYAAPVLVIDALEDHLTSKRSFGPAIDDAIDSRQGARRITLLLGNVKVDDLMKMVDPRTHSRLERTGAVVQIAEADRRKT